MKEYKVFDEHGMHMYVENVNLYKTFYSRFQKRREWRRFKKDMRWLDEMGVIDHYSIYHMNYDNASNSGFYFSVKLTEFGKVYVNIQDL